jgi:hypothetical protein
MATRRKINWDSIAIAIDNNAGDNDRNPYAASSLEDRDKALRDLVRNILLRRAMRIASN